MYSEFREEYFKHKQIVKISGVLKLLFENTYIYLNYFIVKRHKKSIFI